MEMPLRKCLLRIVLLATFSSPAIAVAQVHEETDVYAVWTKETFVLVYTGVNRCNAPYPLPQFLVSTDSGHTWKKRRTTLEGGADFSSLSEKDGKLWMAGENTAEGPEWNPFVFVPGKSPTEWEMRTIYDGPGALRRIAWGPNGELNAWVKHLRLSDEGWAGTTYVHQSLDGGRTWKELGRAKKVQLAAVTEFTSFDSLKNPLWQIIKDRSTVQHRETKDSPWKTVFRFSRGSMNCSDRGEDAPRGLR
jgi:hypothetical protein